MMSTRVPSGSSNSAIDGRDEAQSSIGGRRARLTPRCITWLDVAMKRVKIAELKDQLSKHLRDVERGGVVEVTDRDRPIARIVPIDRAGRNLSFVPPKRPFSTIRSRRYRPARWGVDALELLLEERQRR